MEKTLDPCPLELLQGKTEMRKTMVMSSLVLFFSLLQDNAISEEAVRKNLADKILFEDELTPKDLKSYGIADEAEAFQKFASDFDVLVPYSRPAGSGTGTLVRIDSRERALEVVNDEFKDNEDVIQKIAGTMSHIKQLADSLKPYINKKATVSVALKNLTAKDEAQKESAESAE